MSISRFANPRAWHRLNRVLEQSLMPPSVGAMFAEMEREVMRDFFDEPFFRNALRPLPRPSRLESLSRLRPKPKPSSPNTATSSAPPSQSSISSKSSNTHATSESNNNSDVNKDNMTTEEKNKGVDVNATSDADTNAAQSNGNSNSNSNDNRDRDRDSNSDNQLANTSADPNDASLWDSSIFEMDFTPSMDIFDRQDHYAVNVNLPGVKKDQVKVTIYGDRDKILTVSGERKNEVKDEKDGRLLRYESSYGSFSRSMHLPDNVKADDIKAKHEDGVLKLLLPKIEPSKNEQKQTKQIAIE